MDNRVERLCSDIGSLRDSADVATSVSNISKDLDGIFLPDAKCIKVVYTLNYDKLPFGCIVMPNLNNFNLTDWLVCGNDQRIDEYSVEIDSKLFDYGFTDEQVAEVILYNIFHLVKDFGPLRKVRDAVDLFFVNHCSQLNIKKSVQYDEILKLGCVDALVNVSSCFSLPNDVVSDPFLESLGLDSFEDTLALLYKEIPGCENEVARRPKLNMLEWALRLYDNVDKERIPALHLLDKAKDLTASTLYIAKFQNVVNALNRIDTDMVVNEAVQQVFTEAKRRGGLLASLKYNGLRDIENDLYEFQIRAKNAETESEVMYALKQINARLAILDDYIRENPNDSEIDRWIGVKMQYIEIRDVLAKKKLHKRAYGIFVDYDALDKLDDDNNSDDDY